MDDTGGAPVSDTYTEAELKAEVDKAVKAATAELEARVGDLTTAAQTSEVEAARAAMKAEFDEQLAAIQAQLDDKVLEATTAAAERDAIKAWLDGEAAALVERQAIDARKADRLEKVKAVATFPEDYLSANAERFAAMDDDDFQVALDGWAAITAAATTAGPPAHTALHAGRESTNGSTTSATKELFALRRDLGRVDLSTL